MYNLLERVQIATSWVLSFRRRHWSLSDYPVRVRPNAAGDPAIAWMAQIMNWPGPVGVGASPSEARKKLQETFEEVRSKRTEMPRPGSHVPVEFASSERVSADPELLEDFIRRVLRQEVIFVSDATSLYDFGDEADVEQMQGLIRSNYGVEVKDLDGALLADILERIRGARG